MRLYMSDRVGCYGRPSQLSAVGLVVMQQDQHTFVVWYSSSSRRQPASGQQQQAHATGPREVASQLSTLCRVAGGTHAELVVAVG